MKADDAFAGSGLADEPLNFSAREDSPYERHCLTDAVRRAIDQTRRVYPPAPIARGRLGDVSRRCDRNQRQR